MENFRYYVPTDIRFGKNRLNELPEALKQFGQKILFVYGGGSIKTNGLYDEVLKQLIDFEVSELSGIEPNPKIESVRKGIQIAKENNVKVILAVGGGSVIDAAKIIAAGYYYDGDAWDLVLDSSKINLALPIVDVLTIAATGTEMNRNAVISNSETKEKLGAHGLNLIPKISFLDPTNTFSVSKYQTAAGSIDIMSHIFEQYFNSTLATDLQDAISEGILKTVIKNTPIALKEPINYDARANLLWASSIALNGLESTGKIGGWTVHPIEHELSAYYDITHGVGLGIITPRWLQYILNSRLDVTKKIAQYGKNVWGIVGEDDLKIAQKAIDETYSFFKSLEIPMSLSELNINNEN
ncbi:MAG: iron-containing alcohol dehydrogenase, partial [Lactobacillaceae bacterium]|nr:iron-containing alcohol dehydrogenase [Lactobacillaceae bacterium]